jgi:hypothetical protein
MQREVGQTAHHTLAENWALGFSTSAFRTKMLTVKFPGGIQAILTKDLRDFRQSFQVMA